MLSKFSGVSWQIPGGAIANACSRMFPSSTSSRSFSAYSGRDTSPLPSKVDVLIVGGGVTGTSLLYGLSAFTNVASALLVERRDDFARVSSGANNNSQTIHTGDIETNYTPEKAAKVKRVADMLRNYASHLPEGFQASTTVKMQKMAIGVGPVECEFMEKRFHAFKPTFPNMKLASKKMLAELEPAVVYENVTSRRFRPEPIVANLVEGEHTAVDYYMLSKSFVHQAEAKKGTRNIQTSLNTSVIQIMEDGKDSFRVLTNKGMVHCRHIVVSACGHSLLHAHRLGYGLNYSCLPVAGSFYFGPEILRGKVYSVQNPELPFAAVHGDPDLVANRLTRFGPTALALPMLERYNKDTIWDFLEVLRPNVDLGKAMWDLLSKKSIRRYMMKNVLFEVPYLNRRLFLKDVQKLVPSMELEQLEYAHGFGAVRPQLIDKDKKKLILGEGKIAPENTNIIFNITPSPGGTTCLGNAEEDMRTVCKRLGYEVNEKELKKQIYEGPYPVVN